MYDIYDQSTVAANDKLTAITIGANYFMSDRTKIQANYIINQEETNETDNNAVALLMQIML
jgi:phosphate-selective porin